MNITREHIDDLNAIVKVDITKEDYSDKVNKILSDYRKNANIPGFRKGHVPMGLVKKQYGKAVLVDEVNKLLQDSLNKYLTEEKLDVLGNPLPKTQDNLDWDAEEFSFEFELGLAPEFAVNLETGKPVTHYKIVADDKMLDEQIERIAKQYGKLVSQDTITEESEITGIFKNADKEIEEHATFEMSKIAGEAQRKALLGAAVGSQVTLSTAGLFEDAHDLMTFLKVSHDEAHDLDIEVSLEIQEANKREAAEINEELLGKLFPADEVATEEALRARIKEDAEKQFAQQADQKLLNDVTEALLEETQFNLPSEFLKRWIQLTGEKELSSEEAAEEYSKSEKGLRYQLIEGKIIKDHNLNITVDEIRDYAKGYVRAQMAQFGQMNPEDKVLEDIANRVLGNQEEVRRLSEQLMNEKLVQLFKDKANLNTKEVTFDAFVKEVYG